MIGQFGTVPAFWGPQARDRSLVELKRSSVVDVGVGNDVIVSSNHQMLKILRQKHILALPKKRGKVTILAEETEHNIQQLSYSFPPTNRSEVIIPLFFHLSSKTRSGAMHWVHLQQHQRQHQLSTTTTNDGQNPIPFPTPHNIAS